MTSNPEFPTVFRGYDPIHVDQHLQSLYDATDDAKREAEDLAAELAEARRQEAAAIEQAEIHKQTIAEMRESVARADHPTFVDLGERVGSILTLADEEALAMRSTAKIEADSTRQDASDHADKLRNEAETYAQEVRSRADVEASDVISRAKAHAETLVDDAEREAAARREEAEAYYENQRARAAAAAADFEATLGERRDKAASAFAAQMAKHEEALASIQDRASTMEREADNERMERAKASAQLLEDARAEANRLIADAKEQAARVRRDSERELAAAAARRDSINAQLSNVRNMLATLSGAGVSALMTDDHFGAFAESVDDDSALSAPATVASVDADQDMVDDQGVGETPVVVDTVVDIEDEPVEVVEVVEIEETVPVDTDVAEANVVELDELIPEPAAGAGSDTADDAGLTDSDGASGKVKGSRASRIREAADAMLSSEDGENN